MKATATNDNNNNKRKTTNKQMCELFFYFEKSLNGDAMIKISTNTEINYACNIAYSAHSLFLYRQCAPAHIRLFFSFLLSLFENLQEQ